jgi:hypothetical protein
MKDYDCLFVLASLHKHVCLLCVRKPEKLYMVGRRIGSIAFRAFMLLALKITIVNL